PLYASTPTPLSGVFLRLGVVLGVGFGCSFLCRKKTKRDKKVGLGVVLGVVLGIVLCGLLGGVMHVEYAFLVCFWCLWGGVIQCFLLGNCA
ncbi:hypothetical protein, partial [Porphyromonas gingivalis]